MQSSFINFSSFFCHSEVSHDSRESKQRLLQKSFWPPPQRSNLQLQEPAGFRYGEPLALHAGKISKLRNRQNERSQAKKSRLNLEKLVGKTDREKSGSTYGCCKTERIHNYYLQVLRVMLCYVMSCILCMVHCITRVKK